ncbi:MAG: alanine--tRNA ligase, partial [Chloroflexi bacterium]|nr:alanine--tRNA ligase [Chloroflexota bacterium]
MTSSEIRRLFLEYFQSKGHLVYPSSSLVPHGDPTLLLTSAGMVQFKPYFMGEAVPPNRRLATSQKCFRTVDIDTVGNERNLTFFEMLGNFSIGDYFKEGAIGYAWELVTEGYGLPAERLWASIYPDDEEAFALWQSIAGLPPQRIVRLHENWWGPAGEAGPCGPDSEIFLDRGPEHGCGRPDCQPGCDCKRYLEIWNLVFMQYNQAPDKTRTPLPQPSIDTGMGLERMAMLLNGCTSVYETDLFFPIIERAQALVGARYGSDPKTDYSLRVIADHSRAVAFLIGDGVLPSNEGRGYVLRRVLRRAVRHGYRLGIDEPFLDKTAAVVVGLMGDVYPELEARSDFIYRVARQEEERFRENLESGLGRLDVLFGELAARGERVFSGQEAFKLYDSFVFPNDVTRDLAAERGLVLDEAAYDEAMSAQRERARAAHQFSLDARQEAYRALALPETRFLGYETMESKGKILSLLSQGDVRSWAETGDEVEIVLDQTPFYAESGGQVGDTGKIVTPAGQVDISDTQKLPGGVYVHYGRVTDGKVEVGAEATATVDVERRLDIARNHTATHLLHKALREVMGSQAQQAGSLVAPDRLRFDFTHLSAPTPEELERLERMVNAAVRRDMPVGVAVKSYDQAVTGGAIALFGEKYGDTVRVVSVGAEEDGSPYSQELCGGTHLSRTGQIGTFLVLNESSIGAGLRRIEALTGRGAEEHVRRRLGLLAVLSAELQTPQEALPERVAALQGELASAHKEIARLQRQAARGHLEALTRQVRQVNGLPV